MKKYQTASDEERLWLCTQDGTLDQEERSFYGAQQGQWELQAASEDRVFVVTEVVGALSKLRNGCQDLYQTARLDQCDIFPLQSSPLCTSNGITLERGPNAPPQPAIFSTYQKTKSLMSEVAFGSCLLVLPTAILERLQRVAFDGSKRLDFENMEVVAKRTMFSQDVKKAEGAWETR